MQRLVFLMIFALAASGCVAAEQSTQPTAKATPVSEDDFWAEDWGPDDFPKIPEERINRFIEQIRRENPARADELEKLRKDNPDEFLTQLRSELRKMFRRQAQPQGGPGAPPRPERRPESGPEGPRPDQGGGGWRGRMERMHNEFIAWLEKNYPEQAEPLKQLREKEPDKYMERYMELMRKYGPIMGAEKDNPKLAQVMKDDLELQKQRDTLLRKIRAAEGKDREKLIGELKDNVSRRFDIIMARKQLQYDDLKKRLEELQKDVNMRESELGKLKANKDKAVAEHIDELVSKAEKMQWD